MDHRSAAGVLLVMLSATFSTAVLADAKAGEKKAQVCLLCHKPDFMAAYAPLMQAQPAKYLYSQIKAFKEKRRGPPEMQVNVASLSDKDMRDIAEYFAVQKPPRTSFELNPENVTLGKERATELKCASCHRQDLSGGDSVPRLAGQVPGYVTNQLNHFRSGKRAHGKESVADGLRNLTEQDAENLGHYFASIQ